jgi:hypothetical protein
MRTATAGGLGELTLDAPQVTLGGNQGVLMLESVGQFVRVTRQVGLLAGETIPRRLQFAIDGFREVVEALKEPSALGGGLERVECPGGSVFQRIALVGAAKPETDCAHTRRLHRHFEPTISRDRN